MYIYIYFNDHQGTSSDAEVGFDVSILLICSIVKSGNILPV